MKIKIDTSKMKHLEEKSHYNYNYYSYGNVGVELLEVCNEDYNTCDYYLISDANGSKVFLGSSECNEEGVINFMYMFT